MLNYGCTRLEIGVQSVYEDVARDTNRLALSGSVNVIPLGVILSLQYASLLS